MTTLVIGDNALAGDLVLAFDHGGHLYERTGPGDIRRIGADGVTAVVDVTEPVEDWTPAVRRAARAAGVPLLRAIPPSFAELAASTRWTWVESFAAAKEVIAAAPGEVVLSIRPAVLASRLGDSERDTVLPHGSYAAPPGSWDDMRDTTLGPLVDRALSVLRRHSAPTLVATDSGDLGTRACLEAADRTSTPVVIVRRPPMTEPPELTLSPIVGDVIAVARWIHALHQKPSEA